MKLLVHLFRWFAGSPMAFVLSVLPLSSAPIPGLFNTGVDNNRALLANSAIDPHYRLVQRADGTASGSNAFVVIDTLFPILQPAGPWLASGPNSKWIGPMANQSAGSAAGDYRYRTSFDLTGLEPNTAVITLRMSSDNALAEVLLNGASTGLSYDGNFAAFSGTLTINSGFIDGTNTLDFVVNNAGTTANPTAVRVEFLSGTADPVLPPGTPPSITAQPASMSVGFLDPATFTVGAVGSRPLSYQWRRGGSPIAGATNATLTLPGARDADAGSYDVVVSNDSGSATSAAATLTVTFLSPAQLSYEPRGPATRRTGLVFSEIMYHPAANADGRRTEFIEIFNSNPFLEDLSGWRLTGDADYTFPANTVLQGNSYLVVAPVPADVQAAYGISGVLGGFTNNLPNEGGVIRLRKKSGAIVLEVNYSDQVPWPAAADGTGHSLALVRPSYGQDNPRAWAASAFKGGSPGAADPVPVGALEGVVINEFLANTDPPLTDYVELFNGGAQTADLSGCWLSDDPATNKFRIADGSVLGPRGFIVFDQATLGFGLQGNGETIYFLNSNATRVLDAVRFEGQASGVASGRFPDGAPGVQALSARTPGTTNSPPLASEVVINEIMYNPISGDNDDEFVELHNPGPLPVDVGGWQFTAGIRFTFAAGTTIPAGGYLVVAANASRLATNYPGLTSANLVGNFNGSLANGGERIALGRPDISFTTNGGVITTNIFYSVVDEVTYVDGGRWGRWSDGGGSSLELIDPHSDNRLAANWADSDDTGKSAWATVEFTGLADLGSGTADRLHVLLLDEGEALVDDVEVIVSGQNRVANGTFESGTNGWRSGGTHVQSGWGTNGGFNSARSLHLRASARGDNTANRVLTTVSPAVAANATVTIRAKARWLRGHPELLLRLKGNYAEAFGRLALPANLGTPGAANSQSRNNAGPSIADVAHRPVLPLAGQPVRVTARVSDPHGVASAMLAYRIDGEGGLFNVPMVDDGTGADAMPGDGIFTGVIPGQATGKLIAFRVQATDGFATAASAQFPSDAPARECLVRVGETVPAGLFATYRLWLTAATVATWAGREKLSNHDLDGTFVYGNFRAVYNIGAHYSGSPYTAPGYTSPVGALCGYDIIFPDDDPFLGETHTVLDWPIRDVTDQREPTMFWLLDQAGLPNMYRRSMIMFVNGVRRGEIYNDIQQPGGATVEQWFSDDPDGTLMKPDCWDEFNDNGDRETGCIDLNSMELFLSGGVKKLARYRWVWKPRSIQGTANDYSQIFNLVDAANAADAGFRTAMESQADMEHWMRTFAVNDMASYWDAFGNPNAKNTFLYKPERGLWQLMCWDMDVGLGASTVNAAGEAVDAALFPTLNDTQMNRVYTVPAWTRLYWCAMAEAVNSYFQASAVTPMLASKYAAYQASGLNITSPFVPSGGSGLSIPNWITARRNFLLGQLASPAVSNVFNVSGPATFATNRNLITISGTAPVTVHTIRINGTNYTPVWLTVNTWRLQVPVTAGTNELVIAALDRRGNVVSNFTRIVEFTGADEQAEDNIIINEIMYNPLVSDATFIELFNRSATHSFDLSGWRLNGVDFTFPPGTILTNRGLLVICKDRAAFGNAYGWGIPALDGYDGQLDDGGETLTLIRPGATPATDVVVNRVSYDDDPPWLATADGQGASLQVIDANQDNNRVSNWSDGSGWRFFSHTRNVGSTLLTNLAFFFQPPNLPGDIYLDDVSLVLGDSPAVGENVLINGGFEEPLAAAWRVAGSATNTTRTTAFAHSGAASVHVVFAPGVLSLTNFAQSFPPLTASTNYTLSFWYLSGTTGTNFAFRINSLFNGGLDPRSRLFSPGEPNSGSALLPPYPPLWLSEVQPLNTGTIADNVGDHDPWLEIYNGGANALNLDGWFLANTYSNLTQWAFPPDAVINPGEFLLVWADGEPGESTSANLHTSFRLNPTNGAVALSRTVNGSPQILDYFNYRDIGTNRSYGTHPPRQGSFRQVFYFPTPRATNNPAAPPVTLFINEWMAANASFVRDPADQDFDDWFEIYNPTTNRVDLSGFTLTDDFTRPRKAVVPAGITVPPQGYLLVWADEEGGQTRTNGDLHVNFRLSQGGEQIALHDPAGLLIDSVVFPAQTDNLSQGRWPSGSPAPFYFMPAPTPRAANLIPAANPPILSVTQDAGNLVTILWSAQPGRAYQVQYSDDLNSAHWAPLGNDVTAIGNTAFKTDLRNGPQRFYRVVLVQ
jgi:hypothetical protein